MRFNPIQKIYVMATTGALGDTIATFPTLRLLADRGHIEKIFVDNRYFELYRLFFKDDILVSLDRARRVIPANEVTPDIPRHVIDPRTGEARFLDYPLNPNLPVVQTMRPAPTSIHCHLVDCFSIALCDAILKESEKDYPGIGQVAYPRPVEGKYAVIAYGATTEHRRMLPEAFDSVVEKLIEYSITPVVIGNRNHKLQCNGVTTSPHFDGVSFEKCINLIDKTTIVEALGIISGADVVVGLDNGLIHLAGLTDVPIVVGYTTVDPYYRMPYRHGEKGWHTYSVVPDSLCKYCQTETYCTYGIDFLRCNSTTFECMNSLSPQKWLDQLDRALERS